MKANISVIIVSLVVWFVFLVVQSSASPVHNHGKISPFNSSKHKNKLHCDINRHDLSNTYCPYRMSPKKKEDTMISTDCNGKTSATIPVLSQHTGSENLLYTAYYKFDLSLISQRLAFLSPGAGFFLPKQIDPPPRNV